jgi:EmrB/QacA subfamily drug resistance transporter
MTAVRATSEATGGDQRWRAIALLVAGAFFMENLDGTILTTALPKMAISLGVPAVHLSITVSAYLVTLGVLIPISGWVTERVGARLVFTAAIAIFTLASGLCAISTNLPELTAMRVLQGAGGAMMVPVGRLVVLRRTAKEDLIRAIALLTWPALVAPVLAPAVGGLLTTYASWRWIFVINLPLGVVALVTALRIVPPVRDETRRPLDLPGFVLTGVGLAVLVAAAQEMTGDHVDWVTAGSGLAVGAALTAGAAVHLGRVAQPLLDLSINRVATFRVAMLGGSLFRLVISAAPFLLTLQFQDGLHWSPVHAGLMLIALFAGNIAIKPLTTPILRRFSFRLVLALSAAAAAATLLGCAAFTPGTPALVIAAVLFCSGVFRSIGYTAYNTIVFADVPAPQMSNANTLQSTVQQLSVGLGVAVGALAVRAGSPLAHAFGAHSALAPYAIAFVIVALLLLGALAEALALAPDAGASLAVRRAEV